MAKEITELLQNGGAAGDSSIGLDSDLGLVRRDLVPYDKDASAVDSAGDDLFIGVSVSGEARTFNAIPYIKGDTAATPAVDDLVVGIGNDGSAKQFTVASLATTLEGTSFGTAAFVNHGTAAGEVPLNSDLGELAYKDSASVAEAEAGVMDKYPDAAGVLASINANGFDGSNTSLVWSGSSTSVDLDALGGGYPGDGLYIVKVAGRGWSLLYFIDGETSTGIAGFSADSGLETLAVYTVQKDGSNILTAPGGVVNQSNNSISPIGGGILKIRKIVR